MRKIISIISTFVFILSMSVVAMAAPAPKTATVSLTAPTTTIKVGESITLTATTLKQGSSYIDSWTGATKESTILDEATGNYVSTATFSATTPGTYTIIYGITMSAGKSGVTFVGTQSITITVVAPSKIVGAFVKNVQAVAKYNPKNQLTGYDATGDVYAVWSNGHETYYGQTSFNFSPNQTSRNIDVTINDAIYTVPVTR